ncbi:MAG: hypothetical protein V3573_10565 [Desulfovibrionaceae bacterium]
MQGTKAENRVIRITNCLQTILELEPELRKLELGTSLLDEFAFLKQFLEKVDHMHLSEAEVERIEKATAKFLDELRLPFAQFMENRPGSERLQ